MNFELTIKALAALEAAAEAIKKLQTQPNMPCQFEVGKVYKMTDYNRMWFFKFKEYDPKRCYVFFEWGVDCLNTFSKNSHFGTSGATFSPSDPSEYSQYLPDGHPDKIPQLSIKGAWYEVVSVDSIDNYASVKVGDKVKCIEDKNDCPECEFNGKSTTANGEQYMFHMHQLRHLPNYSPKEKVEYVTKVDELNVTISQEKQHKAVAYANILYVVEYCNSQFESDAQMWIFDDNLEPSVFKNAKRYGYHFTSRKAIELAKNTPDFIKQFEVWMG